MKYISFFSNPTRFLKLMRTMRPYCLILMFSCISIGLYFALLASPADYQQKDTVRIMYIHVPAAWLCMMIYMCMAVFSFIALVWKHIIADLYAKAIAPIGLIFTIICLTTGMIWGKPMWGTWWVWDARLTSVLLLLFLYLGYIALTKAYQHPNQGMRAANMLAIFGSINLPIIKFSVEWWNTLHQGPSVFKAAGPAIHSSMLLPLFLMFFGFLAYFLYYASLRVETEILENKKRMRSYRNDK